MNVRNLKTKSKTDWARVDQMKDDEIHFSDNPPLDDAFFERAIKVLPRVRVDRIDLKQARRFAAYVLTQAWSDKKESLERDAFNVALIISYCRPFSLRCDLDVKWESSLDQNIAEVPTLESDIELHARVKELRHKTYAHSDARSILIKGVDYTKDWCFFEAELNLERPEVELLLKMIDKWIKYRDDQITLTKPGFFLVAPDAGK